MHGQLKQHDVVGHRIAAVLEIVSPPGPTDDPLDPDFIQLHRTFVVLDSGSALELVGIDPETVVLSLPDAGPELPGMNLFTSPLGRQAVGARIVDVYTTWEGPGLGLLLDNYELLQLDIIGQLICGMVLRLRLNPITDRGCLFSVWDGRDICDKHQL